MQEKLEATMRWLQLADRGLELAADTRVSPPNTLQALAEFYQFVEREQRAMITRWRERQVALGRSSKR